MGLPTGVILGLYWGYIGIMENKMETTIIGLRFRVCIYIRVHSDVMLLFGQNDLQSIQWF